MSEQDLIDFERFWADVDARLAEQGPTYTQAIKLLDMDDPQRYGCVVGRPVSLGDLLVWAQWLGRSLEEYLPVNASQTQCRIVADLAALDAHQMRESLRQTQEDADRKCAMHRAVMEMWPHAHLAAEDN